MEQEEDRKQKEGFTLALATAEATRSLLHLQATCPITFCQLYLTTGFLGFPTLAALASTPVCQHDRCKVFL